MMMWVMVVVRMVVMDMLRKVRCGCPRVCMWGMNVWGGTVWNVCMTQVAMMGVSCWES